MGTSSSRSAPKGREWRKVKTTLTRYTTQKGTGAIGPGNVYHAYVSAVGGTKGFSSSSKLGIRTAQRLANFLGNISALGFTEALKEEGLADLTGKNAIEVLTGIIDKLAGSGKLLDQTIARSALLEVLAELFEKESDEYNELERDLTASINSEKLVELIQLFIAEYIYQRVLSDLVDRIENKAINSNEVKNREKELKEFIIRLVNFDLNNKDPLKIDWLGKEGNSLIERNIKASLEQLEE